MTKKGSTAVIIALLVASCSSAASPTTTLESAPPTTTTTIAPMPTTVAPTTTTATPPTTASSETVGSPAALEALIDQVVDEVGADNLGGRDKVPFLDINNPDPLAAMESIIAFDLWVITTWPDPPMADIYTADSAPGRGAYARGLNSIFKGGSRVVYLGDPYAAEGYREIEISGVLSADILKGLPRGAVAIAYESSSGPFEVRRVEDETIDASSDGWDSRTVVTVLVPTPVGWQIWSEES